MRLRQDGGDVPGVAGGRDGLWTFVRVEGVEPTNNAAERALRHAVIWRKISGGTDSEAGSRFVERMLTVVATCRQQKRGVLGYLTQCHQAHLDEPAPLAPARGFSGRRLTRWSPFAESVLTVRSRGPNSLTSERQMDLYVGTSGYS